jgi:putative ABC transport system permease protein
MILKLRGVDKATVKLSILISISVSNLMHKKLRTSLTVFGIAIGIGAIFFLLSFGIGLQRLVTNEVFGNQSIRTIDVETPNSKIIKLDDITVQRISEMPNVEKIGKSYFFPGSFKLSGSESDSIVYGIDSGFESLTYLNIVEGKLLSQSNSQESVVLNKAALESIGITSNLNEVIGKTIEIVIPLPKIQDKTETIKKNLTIIGIIDSGSGAEVFIDSRIFKDAGLQELTQIKVGANEVDNIQGIRSQIESLGFETASPVDTIQEINNVFKYLNFILVGFGGIGMIIAVLGMFNTLTISLLERTKEIGLMVALGARSVDMRRLFIIEALILSFIGSVLGIMGAYISGRAVNVIMNIFASRRGVKDSFELFANPPILIISIILFMLLVGLVVVYLPARRAQKINPIDALRRE